MNLPRWTWPTASLASRRASRRRAVTRCSSRTWSTSATSRASPARPPLLVEPDELLFVTDGRYGNQAPEELGAPGWRHGSRSSGAAPGEAGGLEGRRRRRPAGRGGRSRHLGSPADVRRRLVRRQRADPGGGWWTTCGSTRRRARSHGWRQPTSPTAPWPRCIRCSARSPPKRSSPSSWTPPSAAWVPRAARFPTIVASGPNGAKPHHHPGDRRVVAGDMVVLDFGALVDGYCSDAARMVVVGDLSDTQQRMLDVVGEAQRAGVDASEAGVDVQEVDRACREVIEDAGWGGAFVHSTGHGSASRSTVEGLHHGHGYPAGRLGGHGGTGCVPPRPRRRAHRGHRGRHRGGCDVLTRTPKEPLTV